MGTVQSQIGVEIPQFHVGRSCPKCMTTPVSTTYYGARKSWEVRYMNGRKVYRDDEEYPDGVLDGEFLKRQCPHCKYQWAERPLDQ